MLGNGNQLNSEWCILAGGKTKFPQSTIVTLFTNTICLFICVYLRTLLTELRREQCTGSYTAKLSLPVCVGGRVGEVVVCGKVLGSRVLEVRVSVAKSWFSGL